MTITAEVTGLDALFRLRSSAELKLIFFHERSLVDCSLKVDAVVLVNPDTGKPVAIHVNVESPPLGLPTILNTSTKEPGSGCVAVPLTSSASTTRYPSTSSVVSSSAASPSVRSEIDVVGTSTFDDEPSPASSKASNQGDLDDLVALSSTSLSQQSISVDILDSDGTEIHRQRPSFARELAATRRRIVTAFAAFTGERLDAHIYVRIPNVRCQLCHSSLKFKGSSMTHHVCKHSEKKVFQCMYCDFASNFTYTIGHHTRRQHPSSPTHVYRDNRRALDEDLAILVHRCFPPTAFQI